MSAIATNPDDRADAVKFILKQLRMGRANAKRPGVAMALAEEEMRYERELEEIDRVAHSQPELELYEERRSA
jgi:hypothetical protein